MKGMISMQPFKASGNPCIRFTTAVVALALLVPLFAAASARAAANAPLRVGDSPPRVEMAEIKGSVVRVPGDLRGKVAILHFWTGGCSSCREEMPAMEALYKRYAKKGLVILAINVGERKETVRNWIRDLGISYPVLLDTDGAVARKYEVVGLPRTFILDRKGLIRYKIVGETSEEILLKRIQGLL